MEVDPFELFKQEIDSEEVHLKVNALHRLAMIATLTGKERVQKELVPYLESMQ